jgi:putative endonuclease
MAAADSYELSSFEVVVDIGRCPAVRERTGPEIGAEIEVMALEFLQAEGLELLCRNYRCRRGEIDLIMRDKAVLVFIEVRYRKSNYFGSAAESITATKQQRITTAAAHYLQHSREAGKMPCRFDVVAVTVAKHRDLDWIKDAFRPGT